VGKTVQIRNVPDKAHRILKTRAAQAGMSLSEYLMRELRRSAERLTTDEILERLRTLPPVTTSDPVDALREARERGYSGGD
jgi:hypothetical protein